MHIDEMNIVSPSGGGFRDICFGYRGTHLVLGVGWADPWRLEARPRAPVVVQQTALATRHELFPAAQAEGDWGIGGGGRGRGIKLLVYGHTTTLPTLAANEN